ncbi:MAG: hypothetical protein WDZ84_08715 [Rhodovibrionaceae bacterium]
MKTVTLLSLLAVLALCGGALAYWALDSGGPAAEAGAGLPAFEEGQACETCSLRHQRLQRDRSWSED